MRIFIPILVVFALFLPCSLYPLNCILGFKAGVGHFSYTGDDYKDFLESNNLQDTLKLGFVAGAFAGLELTKFLVLQLEILVTGAGDAFKEEAYLWDTVLWGPYYGQVKYIDVINYAGIPLLVKIRLGHISVFAGPTFLLRLGNGKLHLQADDDCCSMIWILLGSVRWTMLLEYFLRMPLQLPPGLELSFRSDNVGALFSWRPGGNTFSRMCWTRVRDRCFRRMG